MYNNGDGVPVEVHKEEGVYVPELIFGHLLTSSNYNDDEKKVRSGPLQSPAQDPSSAECNLRKQAEDQIGRGHQCLKSAVR